MQLKKYILMLFIYTFINIASAEDNIPSSIQHTLPEGSNLKVEVISNRYFAMTKFRGDIRIVAKYVIEYDKSRERKHTLTIFPTSMIEKLPKISDRGKSVEIDSIFVGKSSTAIVADMLGPNEFRKLTSGKTKMLSGEAEFLLTGLSAHYECDKLVFSSGISKVLHIIEKPSSKLGPKSSGC